MIHGARTEPPQAVRKRQREPMSSIAATGLPACSCAPATIAAAAQPRT
jgi:hypothetical protein